jgi:hypothetical protein
LGLLVKPSTAAELAGFGLLAYAAYSWQALAGLALGGIFLLVIGYSIDDEHDAFSLPRITHPVMSWRVARREKRQAKDSK